MDNYRRKSPEEILLSISKLHRGRLKIFIGAVSGTGKTYHMLREGAALKDQGIDVVICAVSTLQRPETMEQLRGLERVPSIPWISDGIKKKDLNMEALLERNPEVVLVDGLAHRNRPGAERPTRWDDIQELLARGISVMTTVNVYELEGVRELAQKYVNIKVEETIPANLLELADEVRLIDVTPETLLQRFSEGNLKNSSAAPWFERGNLGVLRELALRLVAEGVNDSLEKHREEMGMLGPSGAAERILVSTQYHWNGSIYIRRGQQVAKRLNGDLHVVTFVRKDRRPSKEQLAFKQSMTKLIDKVGAQFAELTLHARRRLPDQLIRYALDHSVTRILIGHSKQTFWQELLQGSVVYQILRKSRNMDIFIVADRAAHQGERIMPAKMAASVSRQGSLYHRLSSREVDERIGRMTRGGFKVYIGAAPGVGKTYTMLREGNHLLKKGTDVVIGYLETHGRAETAGQVSDLPVIERMTLSYGGANLTEMDTAAILKRNPELVLVDELAHTNVPGSKHKKRYEDILDILNAGISVISTVNVQHLESLNDSVEQITGVRVRETVPDSILRMADEVELIDVAPQALQTRMKAGKIYASEKIQQALDHFFKIGNLIALRELALREIADDVDERLEAWERKSSLRGPWNKREFIFVCVKLTPSAEKLIRRGFRIAYRLKAGWKVAYLQSGRSIGEEERKKIESLQSLTERLGGTFEIASSGSPFQEAEVLLAKADECRATQLIIGPNGRNWRSRIREGITTRKLLRIARHLDILVVDDYNPNIKRES
ncbi:histidine kinase [Paenibacillus physcomitrellae]|uniref:Potassium-transporting P-type ATPase D chain n=1 Tax=Paenibacillus physcomitrellae TaxID=1619311 RepID=A0ABQ1FLC2_9BACL|nr:histidine kinase [Paenibacillus physcomitrellae]GGA19827.1 potassium-transporting P-type ATPase D chain [Paenibacillus physcomitrellae]